MREFKPRDSGFAHCGPIARKPDRDEWGKMPTDPKRGLCYTHGASSAQFSFRIMVRHKSPL